MLYHVRDYQQGCHDSVLKSFGVGRWADMDLHVVHAGLIERLGRNPFKGSGQTVQSTIANLTTSAGKTIIGSHIMETVTEDGARVMFMADSDELCQQPIDKLRESTGLIASLEKAQDRASRHANIVVSSAQTMARANRRERFPSDHFHYLLIDEAHRGSPRNKQIADYFHGAKVLGLTATAFRSGMKDLAEFYEDVCFEMGTFDMIGQGYITPLKVMTLPINIDLSDVGMAKSFGETDFDADDLEEAIEPYFDAICEAILEHAADRHLIVFHSLISSSQKFVARCQAHGINARHIDGGSEDREELLKRFADREFQLISNSALLTTGWDCHAVDCMLNLRPTRSLGLYRQMVGRIVRVLKGVIDGIDDPKERRERIAASAKPDALILDCLWQYEKLIANPASLIAPDEETAEKMMKKIRDCDDPEFLLDVSRIVQKEKEDQLAKMLKANADRKAQTFDANALAALMHNVAIAEYQPTFSWERRRITDPQRTLLERNRIDADSLRGRGHASVVIDALMKRRETGTAPLEQVLLLRQRGIDDPDMPAEEAAKLLGDDLPVPFGRHKGTPICMVPKGYLNWMAEQDWVGKQYPEVAAAAQRIRERGVPARQPSHYDHY